ncbi:hypothetical protein [Bacteroides pyogenes]|uniref:hypothetical protein n=2 Tax=Bacteroidales TaxID=171549 RepID=UPI002FD88283
MKISSQFSHACKLHAWVMPIIIFVFCACSNDIKIISDFPINQKLKGRQIKALDSLYNAYSIIKLDSKYLLTLKGEDHFVCICDSNFRIIKKILKKGHGSNEWIAPLITGQSTNIKGETYAYVLERGENKLYAININSLSDTPIRIKDFSNKQLHGINAVYRTEDKKYIGSKLVELAELFTYDARNDIAQPIRIPSIDPSVFSANKFELSQTLTTYSNVQRKLAVAYFSFPVIHILDDDGENSITLQLKKDMPKYTRENAISPYSYLVDICSTKDYIYILYDNPEYKQRMNILVISWSGTAVALYDVPRLTCFTVDEDNKRFIGIQEDDTKGVGFEFKYKL